MRIIQIVSDGVPLILRDDPKDESREEAAKKLYKMMESNKVVTLIGKYSVVVVRPSSVTGIEIRDVEIDEERVDAMMAKPQEEILKNREQNSEGVDMILDVEEGE